MLVQRFGVPKVNAGEEIALVGHGQLAEDLVYVDVGHLAGLSWGAHAVVTGITRETRREEYNQTT